MSCLFSVCIKAIESLCWLLFQLSGIDHKSEWFRSITWTSTGFHLIIKCSRFSLVWIHLNVPIAMFIIFPFHGKWCQAQWSLLGTSDLHDASEYTVANTNHHVASERGNVLLEVVGYFAIRTSVIVSISHYHWLMLSSYGWWEGLLSGVVFWNLQCVNSTLNRVLFNQVQQMTTSQWSNQPNSHFLFLQIQQLMLIFLCDFGRPSVYLVNVNTSSSYEVTHIVACFTQ